MMISAAYGMDSTGYSVPYVSVWSSTVADTDPVDIVRATGELSRKTTLAILAELPKPPLGDGSPPGLDRRTDVNHDVPTPAERARVPRDLPPRESSRRVAVEL